MKKKLIRWVLSLVAILAIATVIALNVSLSMAHAASITTSHQTYTIINSRNIVPDSFWHD